LKLDQEARVTLKKLAELGHSQRKIARTLGVAESTIRYHLQRMEQGAIDGRSLQKQLAEDWSVAIEEYVALLEDDGPVNLAAMHDWLVYEHDYPGSLRSVERYCEKHFPKPRRRARRRVETPPGAQAQADWAEWPQVQIDGCTVYAYQFHLRLSHSRFPAIVWSPRVDQLSWHHVHNVAFRQLEGVPATVRVDNTKTAVSRGAGSWGELNPSYRRYARAVRFHIDACPPREPQTKGKVERGIRTERRWKEVIERSWSSWDELQSWTDDVRLDEAARRMCPATGTSVLEAWQQERACLSEVPLLPEPFDLAVTRTVAPDCTIAFDGRRYSVPFGLLGQRVEVHGCAQTVQVYADGVIVAQHPRHGRERIVIDTRHYEGPSTDRVVAPTPLGRMGRRLQQIQDMPPQTRPLDLYAALAEVAR
jgi:transposase